MDFTFYEREELELAAAGEARAATREEELLRRWGAERLEWALRMTERRSLARYNRRHNRRRNRL